MASEFRDMVRDLQGGTAYIFLGAKLVLIKDIVVSGNMVQATLDEDINGITEICLHIDNFVFGFN